MGLSVRAGRRSGRFMKPVIACRTAGIDNAAPAPMTISASGAPITVHTIRRRMLHDPSGFESVNPIIADWPAGRVRKGWAQVLPPRHDGQNTCGFSETHKG